MGLFRIHYFKSSSSYAVINPMCTHANKIDEVFADFQKIKAINTFYLFTRQISQLRTASTAQLFIGVSRMPKNAKLKFDKEKNSRATQITHKLIWISIEWSSSLLCTVKVDTHKHYISIFIYIVLVSMPIDSQMSESCLWPCYFIVKLKTTGSVQFGA